jgi:tetratricopeptide (TPR) repeat protein
MRLVEQLGDDEVEAGLLWCQMLDAFYYGHDADVQQYGMRAVALARQHNNDITLSFLLNTLAGSLRLSGRQAEGQQYAEESRALFRRFDNLPYLARNFNQQAWDAYHQLDFAAARSYARQAAEISAKVYNHWNLALAKLIAGLVDAQCGEWGNALRNYEECLRLSEEHKLVMIEAYAHLEQGRLYRAIGVMDTAVEALTSGYRACQRSVQFLSHATAIQLAATEFARHRLQEGRQWLERARQHNDTGAFARVWNILDGPARAAVYEAEITGRWAEALQVVESRIAEAKERKLPIFLPILYIAQARALFGLGDNAAAKAALTNAHSIAHPKHQIAWLWRIALLRAQIAHSEGDEEESTEQQEIAGRLAATLAESLPRPLPKIFLEASKLRFPPK